MAGATLRRKITYLNRLLEESKDISVLEKQRDELDLLRERVNEAHDNYYSKLTTFEKINEAYQWFDIRDREYFQSRTRINERINSFEQTKAYDCFAEKYTDAVIKFVKVTTKFNIVYSITKGKGCRESRFTSN